MLETKVFKVYPYLENSHPFAPFQKTQKATLQVSMTMKQKEWLKAANKVVYGL